MTDKPPATLTVITTKPPEPITLKTSASRARRKAMGVLKAKGWQVVGTAHGRVLLTCRRPYKSVGMPTHAQMWSRAYILQDGVISMPRAPTRYVPTPVDFAELDGTDDFRG